MFGRIKVGDFVVFKGYEKETIFIVYKKRKKKVYTFAIPRKGKLLNPSDYSDTWIDIRKLTLYKGILPTPEKELVFKFLSDRLDYLVKDYNKKTKDAGNKYMLIESRRFNDLQNFYRLMTKKYKESPLQNFVREKEKGILEKRKEFPFYTGNPESIDKLLEQAREFHAV